MLSEKKQFKNCKLLGAQADMYEGGQDLKKTHGNHAFMKSKIDGVSMLRSQNRRKCQTASSDWDQDPPLEEHAIKLMQHNVNCRLNGRDMVLTAQLFCCVWILLMRLLSLLFCGHRPCSLFSELPIHYHTNKCKISFRLGLTSAKCQEYIFSHCPVSRGFQRETAYSQAVMIHGSLTPAISHHTALTSTEQEPEWF